MRGMLNFNDYTVEIDKLGKIIIYLRKSREDLIDGRYASDEETLSRHEEQLQDWAERTLGYKIPSECIFKEVGSGEKIKTRPVFQEVLTMVEKEDIDGVLVLNCSRLSRGDLVDCGNIIKTFEVTETLVLTPQKIYNLQNKHDKRYFKDELLRGNDYLEQTKELLANGRHWSVSCGKFVGSTAPYGYDKVTCKEMDVADGKGFTLRPNENAEYVKIMFDMYVNGLGTHKIAAHLKEIKAPLLNDTEWDHCKVRNILSSVTYNGYLTWGKRAKREKMVDREVIEYRPLNEKCPVYKGLHKAVIDNETFNQAQERLKGNHSTTPVRRDYDTKNPLASLVKCGVCGRAMIRQQNKGQFMRKRKYDLDKAELQAFMNRHKKALKLTNTEISRRLGIKQHHANEWFGNNPKKFYPSDNFIAQWFNIKELLQIEDNKFDNAITVFEDIEKPNTIVCSGHRCSNVSSYLHIVEHNVLERIKNKLDGFNDYLDNYEEEYTKKIEFAKKSRLNIDKKIAMVKTQLANIKLAFEKGADTLDEYIERKKELNAEIDALLDEKSKSVEAVEEEKVITIKKAVPKLQRVFDSYYDLLPSEQNDLLKNVISEVTYIKEQRNSTNIDLDICWLI